MKDTDFELISDRTRLLTNEGYFERHRELYNIHGMKSVEAWERLESELPLGLRRYTSYNAFLNARRRHCRGNLPDLLVFSLKD